MKKELYFTKKRVTIAGKSAIFRYKTTEIPFYHTEFDGMAFPYMLSEDNALIYLGGTFETRSDDVFLVAYPKSGTHWLTYITDQITRKSIILNKEEYVAIGTIPFLERTISDQLEVLPSPRYMYTHLPYHFVPCSSEHEVKYVVIARNPKDVAVSQFYFVTNMKIVDLYEPPKPVSVSVYAGNWFWWFIL